MNEQDDIFENQGKYGTDPHKLHRVVDPETSAEAANSVDSTKWERKVHEAVRSFGANGCIAQDVLLKLVRDQIPELAQVSSNAIMKTMMLNNTINARFKGLREKGHIVNTGEKRPGWSGRNGLVRVSSEFKA